MTNRHRGVRGVSIYLVVILDDDADGDDELFTETLDVTMHKNAVYPDSIQSTVRMSRCSGSQYSSPIRTTQIRIWG